MRGDKKGKRNSNIKRRIADIFFFPLNDKKAYLVFFLIFIFLALPVFIKPLGYVPVFSFYFEGLGEYFAPYYHPSVKQTFLSEIDSIEYYAYLPSLVIDHDLDFSNQFSRVKWKFNFSKKGVPINEFSIGPALMWLPFFLLGHILSLFLNLIGLSVPLDGYSLFYQLPCFFGSILYGYLGILLAYKMCRGFFNARNSFFATIALWFATPLIFYMEFEPSMSHALSFFTATACIYVYHKSFKRRPLRRWALIGFLGGLTTLIRWQCATLIFFVLLIDFIYVSRKSIASRKPKILLGNLRRWGICGLAALATFIPQCIAWSQFLANISEIPQVTRDIYKYLFPSISQTLFHFYHGFFTWTPIAVPALVGFWLLSRRKNSPTVWIIWLFFLSQVYLIGASDWTSGWSFGQRRLIETFIILALGLGELLYRARRNKPLYNLSLGIGAFFVWFNSVFIFQWIFGYIPGGGFITSFNELIWDKFWVFPHMLQRALVPITGLFNIW